MLKPQVSVIVPNYNHSRYLPERLESIFNQEYQDFEVIILDDCSTDDSLSVINKYSDNPHVTHVIVNDINTGNTFLQWEKGVKLASGELIWIAESDDVANAKFLLELVPLFSNYSNAIIAYSHSFLIDSEGNKIDTDYHEMEPEGITRVFDAIHYAQHQMMAKNCLYNASMVLFRKDSFFKINKDYQKYRSSGDWLFWARMCLLGGKVIESTSRLNSFRQHPLKVTVNAGKSGRDWEEVAEILHTFITTFGLNTFQKSRFRGQWTRHLQDSHYLDKSKLVRLYPDVFDGGIIDYFVFRVNNLLNKFPNLNNILI